jgi:integrase
MTSKTAARIILADHSSARRSTRGGSTRQRHRRAFDRFHCRTRHSSWLGDWRARIKERDPDALVFSTWSGKPISPNNVLRRHVFPACDALGLKHVTWLTLRRTYSSWAHEKGVPGKVVAQLMGHAKVDTTLNVYTQVIDGALRTAVDKVGSELFTIVHKSGTGAELTH